MSPLTIAIGIQDVIILPASVSLLNQNKMTKKINPTILIAGVELDRKNFPKLYSWAQTNPDTLEGQLRSIASAWHEGNLNMAAVALESDMGHM